MELYAWQRSCLEKWEASGYRGIADVVTGAGKTVLALKGAEILWKRYPGHLRVRIVTPTLSLASQWAAAIREYENGQISGCQDPDIWSDEIREAEDQGGGIREAEKRDREIQKAENQDGDIQRAENQDRENGGIREERHWRPSRMETENRGLEERIARGSAGVGMYHGKRKDAYKGRYTIYVINSARYVLARHILEDMAEGYHVFLIADECHHYAGSENRKIFDFRGRAACSDELYSCLGLSATPRYDEGGRFLESVLGKEIFHYRFSQAVREGTVSRFFIYQIGLSFMADELRVYDELSSRMAALYGELKLCYPKLTETGSHDFFHFLNAAAAKDGEDSPAALYINLSYQRAAVSHMAAARPACVCELIRQLDPTARILIFCERIRQAEELLSRLRLCGIGQAGIYHSRMTGQVRKRMLRDFREGEIRILISCKALDEGLDVPEASIGIVMSGTSMTRQRIQRIGRLLRRRADKPWACLYYLYVRESAEDSAFLAEYKNSGEVSSLSYEPMESAFIFPEYEERAAALWERIAAKQPGTPVLKELRRCLLRGALRPDWMTDADELDRRMRAEEGRRERNYLLCMKRLSEAEGAWHVPAALRNRLTASQICVPAPQPLHPVSQTCAPAAQPLHPASQICAPAAQIFPPLHPPAENAEIACPDEGFGVQ